MTRDQHLIHYILHLADNVHILGHQNSAWTGHGPILEQDIALSNIALDLIGQARFLYQYAAEITNKNNTGSVATEDTLAYLRDGSDYRNCLLVEQPNGDWGKTVLRQFLYSAFQFHQYKMLLQVNDDQLKAVAEKSLKEITYHFRWSSEWVIRLGDGTDESHRRMTEALEILWPFTGELFIPASYESFLATEGFMPDPSYINHNWKSAVFAVLDEATLADEIKAGEMEKAWMQHGGKEGKHSEHLGYILTEMQFLQRAYPGCTW